MLGVDENEELIDPSVAREDGEYGAKQSFPQMILENLKSAGVQQAHKEDKITFTSLTPWPGDFICAEGRYFEGETERKRAGIFIGPEFGTVTRPDLVEAAREAATPTSMSSSPAPLTTMRIAASSTSSAASRFSRRA